MEEVVDELIVKAPAQRVWTAIRDPGEHAEWHPFVTGIEGEHVLGSKRRCRVSVGREPGTTEERCSTYDEGRTIAWKIEQESSGFSRMVSDWSAGFSLEPHDTGATRVTAWSLFTPGRLSARLMMPVIRRKFHATQRTILGALKQHAER